MQMQESSSEKISHTVSQNDKKTLRADEICSLAQIRPYVLRFWEGQFDEISPTVSENGQKFYSQADLNALLLIKELLFDRKMTVEVAKIEIKNLFIPPKTSKGKELKAQSSVRVKVNAEQILALKAHALKILSTIDTIYERHFH